MKSFIITNLLLLSCVFAYGQYMETNCAAVNRLYRQSDSLEKGVQSKGGRPKPDYIGALNKLYSARVAARNCDEGIQVKEIDKRILAISTKVDSLRKAAEQANGEAKRASKKADNAARLAKQKAKDAELSALRADSSARITEASRLITVASQFKQNDPTLALQLIKQACDISCFTSEIAVQELQTVLSRTQPASYYKKKIGDTTAISCVAVSGDDQRLIIGHNDGTLSIWDGFNQLKKDSTSPTLLPAAHRGAVLSLAASRDGKLIISAGIDGAILVWNNRNVQRRLQPKMGPVLSVALSSDKRYVVSSHENRSVNIWDLQAGDKMIQMFADSSGNALQVCFSPNGQYIALAYNDEVVRVWDCKQKRIKATLEEPHGAVRSVTFSPDSQYIVSGGDDKVIRVWKWQDSTKINVVRVADSHQQPILAVAFSPTTSFLVSASQDNEIKVWKLADSTITLHRVLRGHSKAVFATGFLSNNSYVYSGSYDRSIKLWDWQQDVAVADSLAAKTTFLPPKTAKLIDSEIVNRLITLGTIVLPTGFQKIASSFYYSPNYQYILASDQKQFIWLWDYTQTSSPVFTIPTSKGKSFSVSSDNSLIESDRHFFRNLYYELVYDQLIPAMTNEDRLKYLNQTVTRQPVNSGFVH